MYRGMSVSDGSPIKHEEVSDESPMSLRSGMSISDGSPIGLRWVTVQACWTPMGLR